MIVQKRSRVQSAAHEQVARIGQVLKRLGLLDIMKFEAHLNSREGADSMLRVIKETVQEFGKEQTGHEKAQKLQEFC